MAEIKLENLGKQFSNGFWAVKELSLEIVEASCSCSSGPRAAARRPRCG